jgi:hypothetical protein
MAIVKATYTRSRKAAKASVRYIAHRPGQDGKRTARAIYGIDGRLEKKDAYTMIDRAGKGVVFFRVVISPDPREEDRFSDLHLLGITVETMITLEEQLGKEVPFIAVEHSDHTAHRHVHVIACVDGRLTQRDLQALRRSATEAGLAQRQERDLARQARALAIEEAQWAY